MERSKKKTNKQTWTEYQWSKAAYKENINIWVCGFVERKFPWLENDEKECVMCCKWCGAYPRLTDRARQLAVWTGPGQGLMTVGKVA